MHLLPFSLSAAAVLLLSACSSEPEIFGEAAFGDGDGDGDAKGDGTLGDGNDEEMSNIALGAGGDLGIGNGRGSGGTGNVCEKFELDAEATPPRVLIIQDLSSSMKDQWQPLDDAMVGASGIITAFGSQMALGYMPFSSIYLDNVDAISAMTDGEFTTFFGANDGDCDISDESVIAPSSGNTAAITKAYDDVVAARMVGGTPTNAAMTKAFDVLVSNDPNDGSAAFAILLTDGKPNCQNEGAQGVKDKITTLTTAGVNTYVISYNVPEMDKPPLVGWAAAGTVEGPARSYIEADNTQALTDEMSKILQGLVPCDYELSAQVKDPKFVRVTIDGVDRVFDSTGDGWSLASDSRTIQLGSNVCDEIQGKGDHTIDVTVECETVVIITK